MKNQLLNLKMIALMCLMMVLGGANVWAQETKSVTCTLEENASSSTFDPIESSFDLSYSRAADDKNDNGVLWNCSKGEVTISAKLKDENSTITKIVANSKCGKITPKLTVSVGNVQFGKTVSLTTTNKDFTFEGQASGEVKFSFTGKSSGKRPGSYYLKTITIYYTEASSGTKTLKSLAISGTPTKTTYAVGEEFDPTGLVVTGTYDDKSTATITNGITWTKNPKTMSLGNTSCTVTASVGEVNSEPFVVNGLNVVNPIVFDFTANPNAWGIEPLEKNGKTGSNVIAGKTLEVDGVVMTATNGDNNGTCIYQSGTNTPNLRIYTGGSITLSAPEGKNISEILFDFDNSGTLSTTEASWSSPTWTGNAHEVTFKCTKNIQIKTISIKLVSVTPEKTSETLNFKATDGSSYYATFSSDKDVVFTNDVTVYGVSVDGGKISTNAFTQELYEVTDATAGEGGYLDQAYYVPANTGVLLECKNATATYYFFKAAAENVTLPANQLMPAPKDGGNFAFNEGNKYYKLAYDNYDASTGLGTGLGFYWGADNGGAFKVKAGTAYLAVPAGKATAKGFAFNGEATGIDGVNANVENAKAIYNLNGQRVASMAKPGLYIVNGKKVVRK